MNIVDFTDKFFAIEQELGLFGDRVDGVSWWDGVRYEVHHLVYYQVSGLELPPSPRRPIHQRLAGFFCRQWLRIWLNAKIRLRTYDFVVFRCPRNKENGHRQDIITDEVMSVLSGRVLIINTYPFYYHRRIRSDLEIERPRLLTALAQALQRELALPDGFDEFVMRRLSRFIASSRDYQKMLDLIAPQAVIMIQNGVEKGLFLASRRLRVPVIELQHGLIQYVHAAYSYPRGIDYGATMSFPDYFFAFSQYWIDSCNYPALHHAVVGNDHYYVEGSPVENGAVLFVSGHVYDGTLRSWAKEAASRCRGKAFIYKLHPNQRDQEERIRADLAPYPNIEVVVDRQSIRELLPLSTFVVVIQSTVAHEALQAGKTLCILPLFDYHTHSDLFNLPQVHLAPSVEDLVRLISSPPVQAIPPLFFNRFDKVRALQLMHEIAGQPTAERQ